MYHIKIANNVEMSVCEQLVQLQKRIWELEDVEVLPAWKLFVTPKIGNILIIGFKANTPIALTVITLAFDDKSKEPYLYLDMVGVAPVHEGNGIAFKMLKKAVQVAKQRKIKSIRWTYDPLRANNANLYIRKLGASVGKYYKDYYGNLSGINRGIPTDRFWAKLLINAKGGVSIKPRVTIHIADYSKLSAIIRPNTTTVAVEIPDSIIDMKKRNIKDAIQFRLASRRAFQTLFSKEYVIKGFYRKNNRNFYIATKYLNKIGF